MSVKTLKRYIKQHDGLIISEATLLNSDLLKASLDVIESFNLRPSFRTELKNLLKKSDHDLDYNPEIAEYASDIFNHDIFYYFNSLCPACFYFGSHPGDGACFGFFKYSEEDIF